MMLFAPQMVSWRTNIKNSSTMGFGESLDQVHFCRREPGMLSPRGQCGLEAKFFGLGLVVSGLGLVLGLTGFGLGLTEVGLVAS